MTPTDISNRNTAGRDEGEAGPPASSSATGRRILVFAMAVALVLAGSFWFVRHSKTASEAKLSDETKRDAAESPLVDVVIAETASGRKSLTLPGETAAWNESEIYAGVNGYVASWLVDIGDRVKSGQTLATIETPELDAELAAAKAKLNASQAGVAVKQAQADFARTTFERWRTSRRVSFPTRSASPKKPAAPKRSPSLSPRRRKCCSIRPRSIGSRRLRTSSACRPLSMASSRNARLILEIS